MMEKKLIIPKVTVDPAAMFFQEENPQEAALHEIQYDNARVLWDALIHREDFQAAQFSTPEGSQRILHHSPRDGVDWQLSYIAPDGIPTMHGDFSEDEHYSPDSGRTMNELLQDLTNDNARTVKEITLLLNDAEKGDRNVDERTSAFIADLAKLYSINNRTPIDPESELFRAFEQTNGTIDRGEYNQVLTDTLMTGGEPPKVAILQPVKDGLTFRPYSEVVRNEDFRSENYNIIFHTDAPDMTRMTPEQLFEHFNSPAPRPGSYYGTSLSVGDIVVTETTGEFKTYFVDRIGMRELPEDFLDTQTKQKILYGLDIRQERDLLQRYVEFVTREGIDLDLTQETERINEINEDFETSFGLADIRTVLQNHQNTLETIYDFQEEAGIDYGIQNYDGYYTVNLTGERQESRTAENYQAEINNRLAMAAQRISENKENLWRMEANPGYQGNSGEYPFFVQRYRAAEPGHRIPEEISFLGDAESASYFMNHINAGTLLGEALQENVSLRQSLNMPLLEGNIDALLITDVEKENLELADRMAEQIERLHRAMEAAGYTYDEINSAREPQGTQYYTYEGGTMQFGNEREALEWINGIVLDDPERQEAVERILHPDAIRSEEDLNRYLNDSPDSLLHTVYGQGEQEQREVAIESTEDYANPHFHQELINSDQQNPDGTFGQVKDFYRVVTIRQEERDISIQPYNNMVFDSREEAAAWIAADQSLQEIPYDSMVNNVYERRHDLRENETRPHSEERQISSFTADDGNTYIVRDEWQEDYSGSPVQFRVGYATEDGIDYYRATADSPATGHREYEYDEPPTREQVYDSLIDDEAERDIDRAEARAYGFRETEPVIEEATENHVYYSLRRPVSIGTYPTDGMIQFENYDNRTFIEEIGREAWGKLTYSRELTPQELESYELAPDTPQIIPIREFFDENGKILVGSDIGLNRETGQVDRTQVYEAVWDFEGANRGAVRRPVIDRDGDYLDRTALYTGYDQYVGMSHIQDRELAPYRELIDTAAQESGRSSSKDWLKEVYTAEVYYAYKNGLTPEQIQYMVEKSVEAEADLPVFTSARESMRNIRHAFEQGMTPEQVDISLGQDDFVQQTILSYLHDGGDMKRAEALRGADMATAHYIVMEYGKHHLSAEKAVAIVQTLGEIHAARVEQEGISPTPDSYMEEDYLAEAFAEISRDSGISAEAIRQIGADFAAQTQERDLRKFVESQENGIATYYPHGEDGLRQIAEEMNRRLAEAAGTYRTDGYTQSKVEMHSIWEESARIAMDMGIRLDAITLYDTHNGGNTSEYGVVHLTPDNIEDFFAYAKSNPVEGGGQSPFRGYERQAYISADYVHANIPTFAAMRVLDRIREQEIVRRRDAQVQVQAASRSSVPGYVVMSQYDRTGQNPGENIFLGLEENYRQDADRGIGIYDNSDNSIVRVSDNPKMFSFLSAGQGWTQSQQEMIDNGAFTAADYAEYDRIQREIIADFPGAQTKRFSIDIDREGSGVPFSPNWQTEAQRPHGEEERSNQNMADEQERNTAQEGITQPEEKKSAKDELSEQLMQGVRSIMESDNYKNWLATSNSYFTNSYSFNNAVLIFMQKPDATYVKSYEAWKDFGRNVGQGAKGAQIFVPVMAYDKTEGALYRMIMSNLRNQIKQNPGQIAAFKVGMSNLEFTMNGNGQIGLRVKGQERGIFASEQEVKRFISSSILGKVPMYYTVGRVFDVKDTIVPEHLWVKKGYTKDEVVKDKDGKPIKNKRGEVKIVNTPERQARFQPTMTQDIQSPKDPAKMAILYDVLKTVSARNGIPVTDVPRETDENLKGGADGYFSRQFSTENPKGFIVMPDDLEPTRKVAVLMHEMGHSDLHGNLAKLAAQMGEDKIPRHMREIQAESVAYATARQFGIETDTSSFQYLAVYSQGFELQDLKKSLDVVYAECKKLTQEISAELDARGLNLDLSEKEVAPMEKSTIDTLCKQYTAYALEQSETVQTQLKELPSLAADNRSNPDLLSVVMEQSKCMDRQMAAVDAIHESVKALQGATTREEQNAALDSLEASRRSIEGEKETFAGLTTSFAEISSQSKATVKEEFARDPMATLESMKKDYPALASLSAVQLGYIAKSEYIKKEYGNLLKTDPAQFVEKAAARAEALDKAISKNGTFVEVNFCEQWTDKPIVQSGAIMHPKVADTIIKQAEVQIRGLKTEAEKAGDYFPYNKCDLTVFSKDGKDLTAYRTRVDIGDNAQTSLSDHLKQLCGEESTLYTAFDKATRERGAKEKIVFNEAPEVAAEKPERGNEPEIAEASTHAEWANAIAQEKSGTQNQEATREPDKTIRKDDKEH